MPIRSMRITAAVVALAVGMTGAAQSEPFNIFSVSKAAEKAEGAPQLDQVRYRGGYRGGHYRRHGGFGPGAAFALGTFGLLAGAAIASSNRYYCDPYYDYCPRRAYGYGYGYPSYGGSYPYYGGSYYGGSRYYGGGRYYGGRGHVRHHYRGGGHRVGHHGARMGGRMGGHGGGRGGRH